MNRLVAASPVVLAILLRAANAAACGGTFCDTGPTLMSVDQTGENILFVIDGQSVEAHVQIQYQGAAARFAWVVPMPQVPAVTVGSQQLFQNLLQATVPQYGFSRQFDSCGTGVGTGGATAGGFGGTAGAGGGTSVSDAGVSVVFQKTVGAFDVTVLEGGTAQQVSDWLSMNNYQVIPAAPSILADYVAQGFVFAAIRLTAGADTDEIHPLVFRYAGNEPCVPLKLTAVAAIENMGVRTFFLGDDRVYPTNYKHVELNPVRLDWASSGANYAQVINRAVDSPVADGKAFVTEYAGASAVVGSSGLFSSAWNSAAFATLAADAVIDELTRQGLASCSPGYCEFYHPLLLPLLHQYLPVPTGVLENDFYGCLSCNPGSIDRMAWDSAAFAADFEARIVEPGQHAAGLLATYPFLTRLFTTISPAEMTEDPIFHPRPDLTIESVGNTSTATRRTTCSGQNIMILPDTREVALDGSSWPTFSSLMPWAERIEEVPLTGSPIVLVDNSETIDTELARFNAARGWPSTTASGGSGGAVVGAGGSSASVDGGLNAADASGANGAGCGCAIPMSARGTRFEIVLAAVLLALSRRKRRVT